jgi:asparagine synthase (glutamine-hydrolysing)
VSDAGFTGQAVEVRYPFLDLRVVEYVLALPPYPPLLDKKLLREAMRGRLPANTLRRPKMPLAGDPGAVAMRDGRPSAFEKCDWMGEITQYVTGDVLSWSYDEPYSAYGSSCIRALCLNFWLQSSRRVRYNLSMEVRNG